MAKTRHMLQPWWCTSKKCLVQILLQCTTQTTVSDDGLYSPPQVFMRSKSALLREDDLHLPFTLIRLTPTGITPARTVFSSKSDNVWQLLRAHPSSFQQALEPADIQNVPGWSGFNAILFPVMPRESNIGYYPMIDGSSTEYSTIYTVLKHGQAISSTLGQRDTVITFDLLIYMKAKQIQWRYPREFSDVVIRMGGFQCRP